MTQFDKLIAYTEKQLAPTGLKLSQLGKDEMAKRFAKSEANGGYSAYWKSL